MRQLCGLLAMLSCWLASGCASPLPIGPNPVLVPGADRDYVWDQVVAVVDDYFQIEREDRVRLVGDVLTVGRIDTFPEVGSTLLEPWRGDSVGPYERLESTLQSIRRRAVVQVIPSQEGYLVDVAVFKELEDAPRPDNATTGGATLRYDDSLTRFTEPSVGEQAIPLGWIPLGRDPALEQEIIGKVQQRLGPR